MSAKKLAKGSAKSKLMWLGLGVLIMGQIQAHPEAFAALIPTQWQALASSLLGIAIMVARFYTTESISEKGESENEDQDV